MDLYGKVVTESLDVLLNIHLAINSIIVLNIPINMHIMSI